MSKEFKRDLETLSGKDDELLANSVAGTK